MSEEEKERLLNALHTLFLDVHEDVKRKREGEGEADGL